MTVDITQDALAAHLLGLGRDNRIICAIAGAPGSGKSTLADALVAQLNAQLPGVAAVLPMDGFHYDDLYLVPVGLRSRKGAPETFDVGGLRHMLARLRADADSKIAVPVFDRDLEIARAGARLIGKDVRIIVAEGNYLLLDEPPWTGLKPMFDVTVMIDVPEQALKKRLTRRWEGYGLDPAALAAKLSENDLPNGTRVRENSVESDFVIRQS